VNVLFVTPGFPPFPGGGERYAQSLALQLMRRECAVTVMTSTARTERAFWQPDRSANSPAETETAGLRVERVPLQAMPGGRRGLLVWRKMMVLLSMLPGDQTALLIRMARLIPPLPTFAATLARQPDRFDVIHAFNLSWEYPMVEAWRWAQRTGMPLVVTPFTHLGVGQHDRVARNSTMDHQLRMLREADAVLTLTNLERAGLIERGLAAERVVTIGGGVDARPPLLDEATLLSEYQLAAPFVLFVGRLSFDKGALHAAEAVIKLRRDGVNVSLVLIGQSTPEFDRFWRSLAEADRSVIRPLGVLAEDHKHTVMHAAALLALPSRTDSFGIVLLEAWSHGLPVVGARAGGIPAVIDDGQNGLLVKFGDVGGLAAAFKRLLQDDGLRRALGQQGQAKLAAQYTWERVADRVAEVYRRVTK
jgi:glycogen synthase